MGGEAINHGGRAHALLSASGAKRWLNCTPSARVTEHMPDDGSVYSEEGTLAHELSEIKLWRRLMVCDSTLRAALTDKHEQIKQDPLYESEMEFHTDNYRDFVEERYHEAKARDKGAVFALEQLVDYSAWVPEGSGTADVVILGGDTLEVIDLKYGKGVPVSAIGNPQIRLYALGALAKIFHPPSVKKVRMTIVQPRLDSITTEEMSVADLLDWAHSIMDRAAMAYRGEGEFKPGDWCAWCKAAGECRARADHYLSAVEYRFKEPPLLSIEEIGRILHIAGKLTAWAKDVQEFAFNEALKGREVPGWKLVEGTARRAYRDKDAIIDTLSVLFEPEMYLKPPDLLAMTQLEGKIGKKEFKNLIGEFITEPQGKPTLVDETDPRPMFASASNDFADINFDE
jgi:hypothetical protein